MFAGVIVAVFSLSKVLTYLLANFPIQLWSFFFGLIVASALLVSKQITKWSVGSIITGLIGAGLAYLITITAATQTTDATWFVFVSGMIAICAMILPGISGSFILILLGKYQFILAAAKGFKIGTLLVFMAGCLVGILSFSHIVSWTLKKYYNLTIAFLAGIMIGSLNKVWPWKRTITSFTDRHGKVKPILEQSILPSEYPQESFLMYAIIFAIVGFALVYFLEKFAPKSEK